MAVLIGTSLQVANGRQAVLAQGGKEVRQIVLVVCPVRGGSDQAWIAWTHVMLVCGLRVVHERLVVGNVVPGIHDSVIAGQACMVLATNSTPLRANAGGREASLEPAPRDALGVQQIANVLARHPDLVPVLELG